MTEVDEKWVTFYEEVFASHTEAEAFVACCEDAPPASPARIMMHQVQRLVTLGDELEHTHRRDALAVLFLVICAECVAKLADGFKGEGQSKAFVRKFFSGFASTADRASLSQAFTRPPTFENLTVDEAVELLYDIRCDVVHEGQYWGFFFHDGSSTMVNPMYKVFAHITLRQLRGIIIRTAVRAIEACLCERSRLAGVREER